MEIDALYPAQGQALLWLHFAAAGALCSALTALLTALSGPGRLRIPGQMAAGALSAAVGCGACVLLTGGVLRAYMLPAMCAGAAAFHWCVGVPLGRLAYSIKRILLRIGTHLRGLPAVQRLLK